MATIEMWMQDIMSQKFLSSDATKLILIEGLCSFGSLPKAIKKQTVLEYIYRVYADYNDAAKAHPDIRIKHICYYGLSDIAHILDIALNEWAQFAPNSVLKFDDRYIYISLSPDDLIAAVTPTRMIINMFKQKYFDFDFSAPQEVDLDICKSDNIDTMGKSIYRNRVFEDIQYCPICEKTDLNDLYAVHILPAKRCDCDEEIIDKNNGLIMCKRHAQDYLSGKFYFKESGFIHIIAPCDIDKQAHLSLSVKNKARREYIRRAMKYYTGD